MTDNWGVYDETYYMRGPEAGVSNYRDYTYKPDVTTPCVMAMMSALGAQPDQSVHDYGCARGYYVLCLVALGYNATGHDVSKWAIENCHPRVANRVSNQPPRHHPDWIICKDVLEHLTGDELEDACTTICRKLYRGALIVVPLGDSNTGKYRAPQDNADKTHKTCWDIRQWLHYLGNIALLADRPLFISAAYKLRGVKQACDPYPESVAFITLRALPLEKQ